ncbi:MAG: hypothetical protein ACFFD2_25535 [Promethearchaeota archaeon]
MDVHKSVLAYCIGSEKQILNEGTVHNTKEGIQQLIRLVRRSRGQSMAMESIAYYHFKLIYALLNTWVLVFVTNPR